MDFYAHKIPVDNFGDPDPQSSCIKSFRYPAALCSTVLANSLWFRPNLQQGFTLMGTKITGLEANTHAHSSNQMSWLLEEGENSKG